MAQSPEQQRSIQESSSSDNLPAESNLRAVDASNPFTSLSLPHAIRGSLESLNQYANRKRQETLESAPAWMVNNSTNIIGASELLAEMLVFKATGSNLISRGNHGKPIHWIIDPPRNLFKSVASRASFSLQAKDLINPEFYRESFLKFTDLERASKRELRRGRLINRWQARSMLSSMIGMSAAALIPDQKENPEDVRRMAQQWENNPIGYIGTRFQQALWFPGWGQHKAQFAGLSKTICGGCSYLSSFRNVAEGKKYFRNPAHAMASIITTASGLQLMLGVDKEQAWSNYGAITWGRLIFLPSSIMKRFYERDRRAAWYAGSVGAFQAGNTFAFLMGGAEKDDQGNLIDKQAIREEAFSARNASQGTSSPPDNHIASPSLIELLEQPEAKARLAS